VFLLAAYSLRRGHLVINLRNFTFCDRYSPLVIILFVAALEWGYCGYNRSPGEAVWRRIALHDYFISHG
ncbi:hypothetical protein, partial [Yersinia pseudotuberculosis]|uniref:hypothetical protein n=1 Tax=Yersinia pseudotuberculosis TaxID=633 RepID=UPI001C8F5C11